MEHGRIRVEGRNLLWEEVVKVAQNKQTAEDMTFAEVCESMSGRTVCRTELEVPEQLGDELKLFAEVYAKNAIEAFKKHTGGAGHD